MARVPARAAVALMPDVLDLLRFTQGLSLSSYQDGRGVWTAGYGHTGPNVVPDMVVDNDQAEAWLQADKIKATMRAAADLGPAVWALLDGVRQAALTDAAFTLGGKGLAGFHRMLSAVRSGDWQGSHDECLASEWAEEDAREAGIVAGMLLSGEWPEGLGA